MDVKNNYYISPEEDIKQIAENLLIESKTSDTMLVYYYLDLVNQAANIQYRHSDSIPLMQDMKLLEIIPPVKISSYPRNKFDGDTAIIENNIYEVKVNPIRLAKFIQNPDIELFLKKKTIPTIYKAEDLIAKSGKLSVINKTDRTVYLFYEGLPPSKSISTKSAWYKVFLEFIKHTRLDKTDIKAMWNTAPGKGVFKKAKNTRKTLDETSYIPTVMRQIYDGVKRVSPEIAKHVKIKSGEGYFKSSYTLEID